MKNKLLALIMMFLLVGPSIAFSMDDDNGYSIEEMDIDYTPMEDEDEFPEESMFVEEEETDEGDEDEGDMED